MLHGQTQIMNITRRKEDGEFVLLREVLDTHSGVKREVNEAESIAKSNSVTCRLRKHDEDVVR